MSNLSYVYLTVKMRSPFCKPIDMTTVIKYVPDEYLLANIGFHTDDFGFIRPYLHRRNDGCFEWRAEVFAADINPKFLKGLYDANSQEYDNILNDVVEHFKSLGCVVCNS